MRLSRSKFEIPSVFCFYYVRKTYQHGVFQLTFKEMHTIFHKPVLPARVLLEVHSAPTMKTHADEMP